MAKQKTASKQAGGSVPSPSPSTAKKWAEKAEFLKNAHEAVRPQLAAAVDLPTFLASAGGLSLAARQRLVEQALVLLEMNYVHLPLKRAMHAVDLIQRLKLVQYRLAQTPEDQLPSEIEFHNEMTEIFTSARDLHTNYLLPAPFNRTTAFLPFLVEEYFEGHQRKYLVSKLVTGFSHPTFQPGVEVLYWNGVPIHRAVEMNGNRQAGSNLEARRARGLDSLTTRPMLRVLPPDEEWVVVGYRTPEGQELELKEKWLVFTPQAGGGVDPNADAVAATALGLDIQTDAIHQVRKILFAPEAIAAEQKIVTRKVARAASAQGIDTSMPTVFRARSVDTPDGTFAYIRIFTFNVNDADAFVAEFVRLAEALPQNGLIIDVRGNGGGLIYASERLLQVLTPNLIEPERVEFINTPLNLALCRQHAPSTVFRDFDLSPWVPSMAQAVETGATYSLGFPITSVASCNTIGQRYYGPVVLITDALCYSATDIFAAGFQDHRIGPILGIHGNTGAGGANVWTHQLLQRLMSRPTPPFDPLPNSPYRALPHEAGMRVAIRRTLRVGERAGAPVEDLGIIPNEQHPMTKADLLNNNVDLINHAAKILAGLPVRKLSVTVEPSADGTSTVNVTTENIARLDVFLNGRPQQSLDVIDGTTQLTVAVPSQGASVLELRGFHDGRLVALRRTEI